MRKEQFCISMTSSPYERHAELVNKQDVVCNLLKTHLFSEVM